MQRAFVIRPFGTKTDAADKKIDFEKIHNDLIAPALEKAGLGGGTTGQVIEPGNIREDMFGLIIEADLVVCDITIHNANVFYELGIRHALRKKRSILIKGQPVEDSTPFDILTDRYLGYSVDNPASAKDELIRMIKAALVSTRDSDSPIFKMLPGLPEVDPTAVQVVPNDFTEEVARASAANSAGWLRLLASEVTGQRFQWPALRLIGKAQWAAGDNDGAINTWTSIRDNDADDIAANLALANLFERQYRRDKKPELLEASNQAIARILAGKRAAGAECAEALALKGRNAKTLWRLGFEHVPDVAQRRKEATSRTLINAYDCYRLAYLCDLNHFWSGLAALQMAMTAKVLSGDPQWNNLFDDDDQAQAYANELGRQVESLRASVRLAIQAAIERLPPGERMWAEISRADMMFLTESRADKVERAYLDAMPENDIFAWNSTKGQLELFASLDINGDLATKIIRALDVKIKEPPANPDVICVIFAGHRIDEPGRRQSRFPANKEEKARELIRDHLRQLQSGNVRLKVLASGAPGADILCHEICKKIGVDSTICLPMPKDDFAREVFGDLFTWRSRFINLLDGRPVLQLSDRSGLPRWLQGSNLNPWERGNRWVLEIARSGNARKVVLMALWDGEPVGDDKGGTAHMVQITQEAGTIDVDWIDVNKEFWLNE